MPPAARVVVEDERQQHQQQRADHDGRRERASAGRGMGRMSRGSAPAGGWVVRVSAIAPIAQPTPSGGAHQAPPARASSATAMSAAIACPPITARGCANGLSGTAKSNTQWHRRERAGRDSR